MNSNREKFVNSVAKKGAFVLALFSLAFCLIAYVSIIVLASWVFFFIHPKAVILTFPFIVIFTLFLHGIRATYYGDRYEDFNWIIGLIADDVEDWSYQKIKDLFGG